MKTQRHPGGLYLLSFTQMAERFSYYGMRAILLYYLIAAFYSYENASRLYGSFLSLVYLTPLIGGYIADKYWGKRRSIITGGIIMSIGYFLLFASACIVKPTITTEVNNTLSLILFLTGLGVLIIGTGFWKPAVSSSVGDLYDKNDERTESAFAIFYGLFNIGCFLAPLLCGLLSKGASDSNPGAYKWGFLCAAVAMVISVAVFGIWKNRYLVSPDGKPFGLAPVNEKKYSNEVLKSGRTAVRNSPVRLWGCIIGAVILTVLFSLFSHNNSGGAIDVNCIIDAVIYAASVAIPILILTDKGLTPKEKKGIGVILITTGISVIFWSLYEQAGSSLSEIAKNQCDRSIGNYEIQPEFFQCINPLAIFLVYSLVERIWAFLRERKKEPSIPVKQGIGMIIMALGYLFIAFGARGVSETSKLSFSWIFWLYVIHAIAELCLSPVGQDLVTKLSPKRMATLLMSVYFLGSAVSGVFSGRLAALLPTTENPIHHFMGFEISSLSSFMLVFAILGGVAGIILLVLCPKLERMMDEAMDNS